MAFPNHHGGAPHPNGHGNHQAFAYGAGNVNGVGNGNGKGNGYGNGDGRVNGNGFGGNGYGGPTQKANQGHRNAHQPAPRGNGMNPNAPQFLFHAPGSQKPQTQVYYGNANITSHPGFAAAAAGPPAYDVEETEEEMQSRYAAYADAEAWTSADQRVVDAHRRLQKVTGVKRPAITQAPQAQFPVALPIDLQNSKGKIITGKSIYTIIGVIEPGGDKNRMSNGIYEVVHSQKEIRVAKLLRVDVPHRQERARAERDVLQVLGEAGSNHINFLYDSHWANGSDDCILILQYCNGNNVEHWIRKKQEACQMFNEGFLWHTIHHLCSALALCHHGVKNPLKKHLQPKVWNAVCHLDVKPANIFLNMKRGKGLEDDEFPTIVLGDFGCAVTSQDIAQDKFDRSEQPFGTQAWYPPEGLPGAVGRYAGRYGKSTDIWQLGAVIACMARLLVVPDRVALSSTKPCGRAYSDALNTLVRQMLNDKIEQRPSSIDIVEKMQALGYIKEDPQKAVSRERAGF